MAFPLGEKNIKEKWVSSTSEFGVAESLNSILERIQKAKEHAKLPSSHDVQLTAVSKKQPLERIQAALHAGHRCFGENRVQEAALKWPTLREHYTNLELRLIGPLQTNKVTDAIKLFDVIESLDREKLARALAKEHEKSGAALPRLLVQVNTGEEPQKSGIAPQDTLDFIKFCKADLNLPIEGLMCIPPAHDVPAPHFGLLRKLSNAATLPVLSMGMSNDFETAVKLGATHIRVGTGVFGKRPS